VMACSRHPVSGKWIRGSRSRIADFWSGLPGRARQAWFPIPRKINVMDIFQGFTRVSLG
jgi:hypothetical protein